MKKKIVLLFVLSILLIPNIVSAATYNAIKLSAVFNTSANVSGIDKVYVLYTTKKGDKVTSHTVNLLQSNSFFTIIEVPDIDEANFEYGYVITQDNIIDKYGFMPVKGERSYNEETQTISINLKIEFDSMGFDGSKLRKNSELTKEEIDERVNAINNGDIPPAYEEPTEVITIGDEQKNVEEPIINEDGSIRIGTTTTKVIKDNDSSSNKEESKAERKDANIITIIVVSTIVILVSTFIIFTIVKISEANKRV